MSRRLYLVPWRGNTRFQEFRVGLLSHGTIIEAGVKVIFRVPCSRHRWLPLVSYISHVFCDIVTTGYLYLLDLLYSYHGVSIFLVLYIRARKASLVVPA
jgi:hypothetical protein